MFTRIATAAIATLTCWALAAGAAQAETAGSATLATTFGQLDAGGSHSCVIHSSGTRCWGENGDGQLGIGNKTDIGDDENAGVAPPVNFGAGTVKDIATGADHTCAIYTDSTVHCWGDNGSGQLGRGNKTDLTSPPATGVDLDSDPNSLGGAKAISAAGDHTCVIMLDGRVRCWGSAYYAVLGQGTGTGADDFIGDDETPAQTPPVDFQSGASFGTAKAISTGDFHTCVILTDDSVKCWGINSSGSLGYGTSASNPYIGDNETPASAPVVNVGGTPEAIGAGGEATCVVLTTGGGRCWGKTPFQETHGMSDSASAAPLLNLQGGNADGVAVGDHGACFVLAGNHHVRCFSAAQKGGHFVTDVSGASAIASSREHLCATLDTGDVKCWNEGPTAGTLAKIGLGNPDWYVPQDKPGVAPVHLTGNFADLALTMSDPLPAKSLPNSPQTVVIKVRNQGLTPAGSVMIKVAHGGFLAYDDVTVSQGAFNQGSHVWSLGTINPGNTATLTLDLTAPAANDYNLTAEVQSSAKADIDSTPNNSASDEDDRDLRLLRFSHADLSLSGYFGATEVVVGETGHGAVTVSNAGQQTANPTIYLQPHPGSGVTLSDFIPSQYESGSTDFAIGKWKVGPLDPGETATVEFDARAGKLGEGQIDVQIGDSDRADPDSTPGNGIAPVEDDDVQLVVNGVEAPLVPEPQNPQPQNPEPQQPVDPQNPQQPVDPQEPMNPQQPVNLLPKSTIGKLPKKVRYKKQPRTISGIASDDRGVRSVKLSITRRVGKKCTSLKPNGKWQRSAVAGKACKPSYNLAASGTTKWSYKLKKKLPVGTYTITARATDSDGASETTSASAKLVVTK